MSPRNAVAFLMSGGCRRCTFCGPESLPDGASRRELGECEGGGLRGIDETMFGVLRHYLHVRRPLASRRGTVRGRGGLGEQGGLGDHDAAFGVGRAVALAKILARGGRHRAEEGSQHRTAKLHVRGRGAAGGLCPPEKWMHATLALANSQSVTGDGAREELRRHPTVKRMVECANRRGWLDACAEFLARDAKKIELVDRSEGASATIADVYVAFDENMKKSDGAGGCRR